MSKDEIIKLAREAGINGPAPARQGFKMYANPQRLERFAALVSAAERELGYTEGYAAGYDNGYSEGFTKGADLWVDSSLEKIRAAKEEK